MQIFSRSTALTGILLVLLSQVSYSQSIHQAGNQITLDQTECGRIYRVGYQLLENGFPLQAYDTLRSYINTCAADSGSWYAFLHLQTAASLMPGDQSRWLEFRNWLFKVLYYNRDSSYYCADVNDLLSTFNYPDPG